MGGNIRTASLVLLAYLLCAEAPGGTIEERWLVAQTVAYRSASGLTIEQVIYAPWQYQGIEFVDPGAYLRLRRQELEENLAIAWGAILLGPVAGVSNFAEPGSADWQLWCELKYIAGKHHFYLCPDWKIKWQRQVAPYMARMWK